MKRILIPARVGDPPHLLMWQADEIAPLMLGVILGILIKNLTICLVVGWAMMKVYRKYRDAAPDGFILHKLYALGLYSGRGRSMINPFNRLLLP